MGVVALLSKYIGRFILIKINIQRYANFLFKIIQNKRKISETGNNLQYLDMNKIEHIGIAVNDMQTAGNIYEKLLNSSIYKVEDVPTEGVKTAFIQNGPNKIELLKATSTDSPIAKFIAKRGEGIHHIAFEVDDIVAEMKRLKNEGFVLLNDEAKLGADNKLVCFVHPKSANGVLIELCQGIS